MNIQKRFSFVHTVAASVMVIMLMLPCAINAAPFRESTDNSHIEKVSDEEIALLIEQQKLLVPGFLAMQQKLNLLQDELDAVKLQLAQLNASTSNMATASVIQTPPKKTGITMNQMAAQQDRPYLQNELLLIALGLFILWLGLRYYTKTKSTGITGRQGDASPIIKPADNVTAARKASMPPVQSGSHASATVPSSKESTARNRISLPAHSSVQKTGEKAAEEDLMLEEAGLYAANGRMDKAAEILREIIERMPSNTDAWTLLLSVYSALCKVGDFESTARNFLRYHKNSPAWSGIQVLGRTLDRDNPLYAGQNSQISAAPLLPDTLNLHRPIGDIMVEMGILPKREIMRYLDDFDPKRHGRFGGYLVARKAISIAQLDQALLQQQGACTKANLGGLPSLQEIEKFLVDFDPKQHGSVSKFLASRNVVTPEQLSQLLRQSSNHSTPTKISLTGDLPPFGKLAIS